MVQWPEIRPVKRWVDFGVGFYTTSLFDQAAEWASRKVDLGGGEAIVSAYSFSEDSVKSLNSHSFRGANEAWLDFVVKHRSRSGNAYAKRPDGLYEPGNGHHKYELVVGDVADDRTTAAIAKYMRNEMSKAKLLEELKFKKSSDQWVFCSREALNSLRFSCYFYLWRDGRWMRKT